MAWTTPRTWIPGELVTASMMNTIRDQLNALRTDSLSLSSAVSTTATTGTITQLPIPAGIGPLVIYMTNTSLASIQGIAAGINGQRLTVFSRGAGQVSFFHMNAGAVTADKLFMRVQTASGTPLAAGIGSSSFVYNGTVGVTRWEQDNSDQGDWISYTPAWVASGGGAAIGNGTLTGKYYLRGKQCEVQVVQIMGSTTTFGTGTYSWTLPFAAHSFLNDTMPGHVIDSGTAFYVAFAILDTTGTFQFTTDGVGAIAGQLVPFTWANADIIRFHGAFVLG